MPEGPIKLPAAPASSSLNLRDLEEGKRDAIGAIVQRVLFSVLTLSVYAYQKGRSVSLAVMAGGPAPRFSRYSGLRAALQVRFACDNAGHVRLPIWGNVGEEGNKS